MPDNIPFELQEEIIKRLPVKSLIQFRSVSKAWKFLIDSPQFIHDHSVHHSHSHHLLVGCVPEAVPADDDTIPTTYASILDDDPFPPQMFDVTVPLHVKLLRGSKVVGTSHGLFCLSGYYEVNVHSLKRVEILSVAVLWNPSIRKSIVVYLPKSYALETVIGFGVCPVTSDPKILLARESVRPGLACQNEYFMSGQLKVFELSSGAWKNSNINMPFELAKWRCSRAVDGFIYWLVSDNMSVEGRVQTYNWIMAFDLATNEFILLYLPDSLALKQPAFRLTLDKLRGSLAVIDFVYFGGQFCDVWMLEDGVPNSFIKVLTFKGPAPPVYIHNVLGFKKNGEPILEMEAELEERWFECRLAFHNPVSKHISYHWIFGGKDTFFAYSYTETLLLLNHKGFGRCLDNDKNENDD